MSKKIQNKRIPEKYDNRPVGVFDSGIGGLTVVSAIRKLLPWEDIVYLGDTARVPYGNKSAESIIRFASEDTEFLLAKGVKSIVVACNTVSATALDVLKERYPEIPLLGVIEAGAKAALESSPSSICVIGTRATVNSDAYRRVLHSVNPSLIVKSIACPLLVPIAEEGLADSRFAEKAFDLYLSGIRKSPPDILLLGCTHYPLFQTALNRYFSGKVRIVDSAQTCGTALCEYLKTNALSAIHGKEGDGHFFLTDLPNDFRTTLARFLGGGPFSAHVEKAVL